MAVYLVLDGGRDARGGHDARETGPEGARPGDQLCRVLPPCPTKTVWAREQEWKAAIWCVHQLLIWLWDVLQQRLRCVLQQMMWCRVRRHTPSNPLK